MKRNFKNFIAMTRQLYKSLPAILLCMLLTCNLQILSAQSASNRANTSTSVIVKGSVKDQQGSALIGASVLVAGTTTGAITDMEGEFSINAPQNATLQVSFIGYKTESINIHNKTNLDIVLFEDATSLDDVVVVGFGTQKKANLTGAVSSVNIEKALGDRPIVDLSAALQGAAPGLQVDFSTGAPGETADFNIRGTTSINGGEPLILVDNVPMDIDMINPQDVESVSVLKDAASAAIYGARAAYGVILITTKKGSKGSAPVYNYNNSFSFDKPDELLQKATPLQYMDMYDFAIDSGKHANGCTVSVWRELIEDYNSNPSKYPGGYTYYDGVLYCLANNNIIDEMVDNFGFTQTHNLSVSGGGDHSTYRVGLGYTDQDGILITDKDSYSRLNMSSFVGIDLNKWLTAEVDVRYANSDKSLVTANSTGDARGDIWEASRAAFFNPLIETYELDGVEYMLERPANYLKVAEPETTDRQDIRTVGRIIAKPIKNLTITGEYTYNRTQSLHTIYLKYFEYIERNLTGLGTSCSNSEYTVQQAYTNYNAFNAFANYDLKLGNHGLSFVGGFNQESSFYRYQETSKTDIFVGDLPSFSLASGTTNVDDAFSEYAVRGLFYRVAYDYKGKYLLEVNGRYDGSSRFPEDSRFGFFPSVSAGYRLTEEPFMARTKKVLNNLKLRASWGEIGNQDVSDYAYIATMAAKTSTWASSSSSSTRTVTAPSMVSADFTWERVATLDFGVDFDLFNNRLSGVFDWYQRDTKDMLAAGMELPGVVGADAAEANVACMRTKGWELGLTWRDRIGQVGYSLGGNVYDSRSWITAFDNEAGVIWTSSNGSYRVGQEIGEIWGYETDRLCQESDFSATGELADGIPMFKAQSVMNPGDVIYKDLDGDGYITTGSSTTDDSGDRKIIGNTTPRYQYAINASVNWKGIDFSIRFRGVGSRQYSNTSVLSYPASSWNALYYRVAC